MSKKVLKFSIEIEYDPTDPGWFGWSVNDGGISGNDELTPENLFDIVFSYIDENTKDDS